MKSWAEVYLPPLPTRDFPALSLHNSVTGKKDMVTEKKVSMYVCGITPYDATHLGHAATYLAFDLVNRYVRLTGRTIEYVQNITDVDDPLLERANRDGVNWEQLANNQISLFRDDMTALRIIPPDHYMGAVETIPWVISAIEELQRNGAVYQIENDLYFDITCDLQFDSYNQLSRAEQIAIFAERGGDPEREGKRNPLDCLIWRGAREGEPSWSSTFGPGRPGWHIECTAIALQYLKAPISIQGGGSDLHFPHHTMCAAEGKVLTGQNFAQRFVHAGMIGLDGEKMSKSRGNLKFVSVMRNSGIDPLALRVALLSGHYRSDRPWSDALLKGAEERLELWRTAFSSPYGGDVEPLILGIARHLSDDLDTSGAFSLIDSWAQSRVTSFAREDGSSVSQIGQLSRFLDAALGIAL
ncbi:MAG: cysteine--1-D-myo-inosityl 2-amino-2-deoxy-alpha-D-glucopyranoside ligase [Candidatus Nanopelagicaceae bacterium]